MFVEGFFSKFKMGVSRIERVEELWKYLLEKPEYVEYLEYKYG